MSITPLICTQNTYGHIDYETPLLATKSTDYRTSTGRNHRHIPSVPQHYDCRTKAKIKKEHFSKNIALKEEFKSSYNVDYKPKDLENNVLDKYTRARPNQNTVYIQNIQEKLFKDPPPPIIPKLSEMKDAYQMHYSCPFERGITLMTPQTAICEIQDSGRAVQAAIRPEEKGYTKLLDIYLTENKAKYIPYGPEQLAKAQEDFVTFYNANGKHKGLKDELPGKLHGNKTIFDKRLFKWEMPCRFLARGPLKHLHGEFQTEYKGKYIKPALSDFFPYLFDNCEFFGSSLPNAGPWQNMCAPGMYRTEYSHIGTGWPVRAVINQEDEVLPPHEPCNLQVK